MWCWHFWAIIMCLSSFLVLVWGVGFSAMLLGDASLPFFPCFFVPHFLKIGGCLKGRLPAVLFRAYRGDVPGMISNALGTFPFNILKWGQPGKVGRRLPILKDGWPSPGRLAHVHIKQCKRRMVQISKRHNHDFWKRAPRWGVFKKQAQPFKRQKYDFPKHVHNLGDLSREFEEEIWLRHDFS